MNKYLLLAILIIKSFSLFAQKGAISGYISEKKQSASFATIGIPSLGLGTVTNTKGFFQLTNIPYGTHEVVISSVGYKDLKKQITLNEKEKALKQNFNLEQEVLSLDAVVVTGTKTAKKLTDSPVIVNLINSKTLGDVQACNLSEGLRFQPGLRVETDCQTCNYTQLRMNGLAGGYSQILINGRPIFSPLTGLYGMEQLPVNMIERIEVVKGGGSSLYGSGAIGGTVNLITKIPKSNSYELNYFYQNINNQTNDNTLNGNATIVSENNNSGVSFFMNHRKRGFYDHNGDNFSEIPTIENSSIGANLFFLPNNNQKLEASISHLNEYRFGGEMITEKPAHLAQQSEERTHNVWMGSLDYQINSKNGNTSFISYLAWQNTDRKHYTGIIPDKTDSVAYQNHISNPPYGISDVTTFNTGVQLNQHFKNFIHGNNIITLGAEYVFDDVFDKISPYNYLIDQTTKNIGVFVQSDWEILPSLTLLSGLRMDKHNLVKQLVFNPRASLLYKYKKNLQFRVNYGTGFRAPQAFDADLHIAFAGGGVSRISLSPNLKPEKSQTYSASINFDKPTENYVTGFTVEGFYTRLKNPFIQQPIGEDQFGERFEKQNGQGATVQGITLEWRVNYSRKIQLESGFTIQRSFFDNPVQYIDKLEGIQEFIRTPNNYGYAILTFTPAPRINGTLNYLYTGSMKVPHFAGAPNQTIDEIVTSKPFSEVSLKLGYTIPVNGIGSKVEFYGGIRNLFNSYQSQFDIGKNRDSNFVYGSAQPRTIYVGLKLKSF